MAMLGVITHVTTYRYAKPVTFGTHRAMFLPRRAASARLLGWSAKTSIRSRINWISDARSNNAWLMIEALRRLGFASRFISGYLYDAALDGGEAGKTGSGATHAWLQVFLPGARWMDYDPTNQINAGFDLIPVAVARHPGQAIPLEGSWFDDAKDYLGMSVDVAVHKIGEITDPSE